MKAVELNGFEGINSLRVVEVEKPRPRANQVLLEVKAAGINFAEIEMTKGRYPAVKKLPFVMGFEAAGIVVEAGSEAKNIRVGVSLQNENVRFEQSRNVRFHRWPRAPWKRSESP